VKLIQGTVDVKLRQADDEAVIKITFKNVHGHPAVELHVLQSDFVASMFGGGDRPGELILPQSGISSLA